MSQISQDHLRINALNLAVIYLKDHPDTSPKEVIDTAGLFLEFLTVTNEV